MACHIEIASIDTVFLQIMAKLQDELKAKQEAELQKVVKIIVKRSTKNKDQLRFNQRLKFETYITKDRLNDSLKPHGIEIGSLFKYSTRGKTITKDFGYCVCCPCLYLPFSFIEKRFGYTCYFQVNFVK